MLTIKLFSIILILLVTVFAGSYPFLKKIGTGKSFEFPNGEALAAGVFLGAGLIHMLGAATREFIRQDYRYPLASLLAGITFLILLLFEHIGREIYQHDGENSSSFAILAVCMLSLHSFLAGAALGLSQTFSMVVIILLAILAHKWAASFALAIQINKSSLTIKTGANLFAIFAVMTPIGIISGNFVAQHLINEPLIEPIFSALAAGTFLYLGTLHGLNKAVMVEKCCDFKRFIFVILGFAIMAAVAIWT